MTKLVSANEIVPLPFTLPEAPDDTPIYYVYRIRNGNLTLIYTSFATLYGITSYLALFAVPADAEDDDSYLALVEVVTGGTTKDYWLDGGMFDKWAHSSATTQIVQMLSTLGLSIDDLEVLITAIKEDTDLITTIQTLINVVKAKTDLIGTAEANLIQAGVTDGGDLVIREGTKWTAIFTLDADHSADDIYFTLKDNVSVPDKQSLIQISKSDGLLFINKQRATTAAHGSLTVVGTTVTIVLEAEASKLLSSEQDLFYDIKNTTTDTIIAEGNGEILAAVTKKT